MRRPDIQITSERIVITSEDGTWNLPRAELPEEFLRWQSDSRMEVFSVMHSKGPMSLRTMPAHLPVLATMNDGPFAINLTNKGMGLLPRDPLLGPMTESLLQAKRDHPDEIGRRAEAMARFYSDLTNFDRGCLGGLEIFEGRTEVNVKKRPLGSLLYTGPGPKYLSYQITGALEVIGTEDPRFQFLKAARELFANDSFHLKQMSYPFGYLFHVSEILVKTPYSR